MGFNSVFKGLMGKIGKENRSDVEGRARTRLYVGSIDCK
jgi:hypothetical protein